MGTVFGMECRLDHTCMPLLPAPRANTRAPAQRVARHSAAASIGKRVLR